MNEPGQSNMLFGALVTQADRTARHATDASAPAARPFNASAFAVAAATLITLLWIAVAG